MLDFINKYGYNDFSQNREDGVVEEVFKRIGIITGTVCEFGAHNGFYCSNTRKWINKGFSAVLIEPDKSLCDQIPRVDNCTIINSFVTPETVNELVPAKLNLLSIDTDGPCYHIWKAYKGRPDIVIIEINSSFTPYQWIVPGAHGSSYLPTLTEALRKGYFLLVHTGNMIFLRNEHRHLFPEIIGDAIENCEEYFDCSYLPK